MTMNKEDYISQLRAELLAMPVEDRENAIAFYEEMFNDAGEENAKSVIADLGSPVELARAILCDNSDYSRSIKNETASQRLFVENCRREKAEDEGYEPYSIGFRAQEYKEPEPAPDMEIKVASQPSGNNSGGFIDLSKPQEDNSSYQPHSHGDGGNASNSDAANVNYNYNYNYGNQPANAAQTNRTNSGSKGVYSFVGALMGLIFLLPFIVIGGVAAVVLAIFIVIGLLMLGFIEVGLVLAAPGLLIAAVPLLINDGLFAAAMAVGGALLSAGFAIALGLLVKQVIKKGIPALGGWIGSTYKKIREFFERRDRFQ